MRDHTLSLGLHLFGFVTALLGSLALTWLVRGRARKLQLFDGHDDRKVHRGDIPRVGGVAVFSAATVALGLTLALFGSSVLGETAHGLTVILLGAAAMHFVGLVDDLYSLRARVKFVFQIIVALGVFAAGVRVSSLTLPGVGVVELGGTVGLVFTVIWLVGVTNAFNLIDGLDGLASGAALFALTTMFVVAGINHQYGATLLTLVLAGATLGFLAYNFHPASIFLGDSGSLFLGFMLAGIGLLSSQKGQTVVAVSIPIVALGLPVIDTALAIFRRFLRGQPIFSADRGHIHHRLLLLGHSPRKAALVLYAACASLALAGMLLVNDSGYVALVLLVVGLGTTLFVQSLRYHEFAELGRVVRKGFKQRQVIGRGVRVREASLRVSELGTLDEIFEALGSTFAADDFQRAELRLRPSFVYGQGVASLDRRFDDDLAVWTWLRTEVAEASLWEIKLPLIDEREGRVGSIVLWQDGLGDETALSHMHTIARELRGVVQVKVLTLWHNDAYGARFRDDGEASTFEVVVPLPTADDGFRRRDELVAGEGKGASRTRRPEGGARSKAR
ncbi:MAG: UDP-N-acetylmuramyl pentapeptide phosphotransferase/UDP-N-acetylglucosamine-phosphate transferase [Gemmatimonadetes bacterium]|nr:UDP-N-acetylmuramyl pentapeptide phosphotransferase/UDP-N-acetylglucosamine-phosphate transferase [Gemmatimonadota bacterium]